MYKFINEGPILQLSNYWDSTACQANEAYLTWNAGVGRLLVPDALAADLLPEIRNTKHVEIEHVENGLQLFFIDNNPDYPYMLQLPREQTDRYPQQVGKTKIAVYLRLGIKYEFDAEVLK